MQRALRRQRVNRRHALSAVTQLPVRTVFYDDEIHLPRHCNQLLPLLERHCLPAGILEIRDDVAHFYAFTVFGNDLGPVGLEGLQGAEVGGGGGEDDVSGVAEDAGADVDALLRGGGDLDVLHRDAVARGDDFAKRRDALRGAVLEGLGAVLFQHQRRQALDILYREGCRIGIPTGEGVYRRQVYDAEYLPYRRPHKRRNVVGEEFGIVHFADQLRILRFAQNDI